MPSLTPPGRWSEPARSAPSCSRSARRGRRRAGRSSFRSRAPSCSSCCSPSAITANLLGLFELPVLGGRAQPAGSFGTGALAAFVATPCAGPFLGAALGTALLLPAAGRCSSSRRWGSASRCRSSSSHSSRRSAARLPKPGPWMQRLQRFLAIPMAASAVAALWLLYRQGGPAALGLGRPPPSASCCCSSGLDNVSATAAAFSGSCPLRQRLPRR